MTVTGNTPWLYQLVGTIWPDDDDPFRPEDRYVPGTDRRHRAAHSRFARNQLAGPLVCVGNPGVRHATDDYDADYHQSDEDERNEDAGPDLIPVEEEFEHACMGHLRSLYAREGERGRWVKVATLCTCCGLVWSEAALFKSRL